MNIEIRTSPIHGRGVFARRTIRKGERIGRFLSRRTDRDGEHTLWLEHDDGSWRAYEGYGRLRFLNHRRTPNSDFEGLDLYATKTIHPNDEITIDYGEEWTDVA